VGMCAKLEKLPSRASPIRLMRRHFSRQHPAFDFVPERSPIERQIFAGFEVMVFPTSSQVS
jgi:hypothetical protein